MRYGDTAIRLRFPEFSRDLFQCVLHRLFFRLFSPMYRYILDAPSVFKGSIHLKRQFRHMPHLDLPPDFPSDQPLAL
jgi:hypothetical protein